MGEVLIRYKVMPESPDVDLKQIAEKFRAYIPEHGRISHASIEPAFFGLKMLLFAVILDDKKGGGDELESKMTETEGVQSVEVVEMGLL
jgi:translation elongation factor aEF-1 beta